MTHGTFVTIKLGNETTLLAKHVIIDKKRRIFLGNDMYKES
ncbi:hypothetical protein SAMN05421736_111127 [Evansella caseinilytica]|uniref:Uncharacterized protein n=1 Tax=Evansella caseinilytica TaxID=1503961 RepID=A0A1H3SNI0_9BACI|nr:hypothetical protein SAMN05421736_111127 [Evansella caseinilytica]